MIQKNQNKQILTDSNNINNFIEAKISNKNLYKRQVNNTKHMNSKAKHNYINSKNKPVKKNLKTPYHYISYNNNEKQYNNTFYKNKIENNNENQHKLVVDIKESIKHGRNSSAPSLKQKINDDQDISKNNRYRDNSRNKKDNMNPFHNNKILIQKKDKKGKHNMSYENHKQSNEREKPLIKSKIYDISQRINNIKQSYNSKPNKKYFQNNLNKFNSNKKSHIYANNKDNITNKTRNKQKKSLKNKEDNLDINLNIFKDILEKQEKIIMMKKKIKK
jgi:hypothetical protein